MSARRAQELQTQAPEERAVTARLGPDDLGASSFHPNLLRQITGVEPEPLGDHVRLDKKTTIKSVQRLALGDIGGEAIVAFWPAELKPQAEYLYRDGRAHAMIAAARECGWKVSPSPHLAYHTSPPERRLYMSPAISAEEYANRWQTTDAHWIGAHSPEDVRRVVWPWLKQRGYVDDGDDEVLPQFLAYLRKRPAHLRPGLRIRKGWRRADEEIRAIRDEVNAILRAAGETPLPARSN